MGLRSIAKVYEVGPRKVTNVGGSAGVYLGRQFRFLIGKTVIVIVKVLEEGDKNG